MRVLAILLVTLPAVASAQASSTVTRQVPQIQALQSLNTRETVTTLKSTTLKSTATLTSATTLKSTTLKSTTLKPTTLKPTTLKPTTLKPTTLKSTVQSSGMSHVTQVVVKKPVVRQVTLVRIAPRSSGSHTSSIAMLREALLGPTVQPRQQLILRPRAARIQIRIEGNRPRVKPVEQPIPTVFRQLQLQLDLVQMNETLQ